MSHRLRNFLLMLPFFLIGIAIPVYYFGWSGDEGAAGASYSSPSDSRPSYDQPYEDRSSYRRGGRGGREVVDASRDFFDQTAESWVPRGFSRLTVKVFVLGALFALGFLAVRLILAFISGFEGAARATFGFLVHKALGPMFMGFLAVGSTWGIHQTVAEQFGMTSAAITIAMTAAVATLFALAGWRVRG
jgi:hypothetical protein